MISLTPAWILESYRSHKNCNLELNPRYELKLRRFLIWSFSRLVTSSRSSYTRNRALNLMASEISTFPLPKAKLDPACMHQPGCSADFSRLHSALVSRASFDVCLRPQLHTRVGLHALHVPFLPVHLPSIHAAFCIIIYH